MATSRNFGVLVEKELVNALNNKRYRKLPNNLKTMIRDMFGVVNSFDKVKCKKCEEFIKPDLAITIRKKTKYVSVKSGHASVVHCENIRNFILFLREIGVDVDSQKTLLLYQYGDGTYDGSGSYRRDYHETYEWLTTRIAKFNYTINEKHEFVEQIVDRCLFQGVNVNEPKADFIYFGDIFLGLVVSRNQIMTHLKQKTWNFYENIHVGPLLLRAHAKYAHRAVLNQQSRERVEIYWPNFEADLKYIYRRYNVTYD